MAIAKWRIKRGPEVQCLQRKILQNQQTSYSGVFKVFDEEFGILYGKMVDIKTYFSWFSLKRTTNSIVFRVKGLSKCDHKSDIAIEIQLGGRFSGSVFLNTSIREFLQIFSETTIFFENPVRHF